LMLLLMDRAEHVRATAREVFVIMER